VAGILSDHRSMHLKKVFSSGTKFYLVTAVCILKKVFSSDFTMYVDVIYFVCRMLILLCAPVCSYA
jgi:hypothetical protein